MGLSCKEREAESIENFEKIRSFGPFTVVVITFDCFSNGKNDKNRMESNKKQLREAFYLLQLNSVQLTKALPHESSRTLQVLATLLFRFRKW